jgi:hypothetical protein
MANSKDSIKKYTPPVETIVRDVGEIPEDSFGDPYEDNVDRPYEVRTDNKPKKRMSGLAGLFSRLKR